MSNVREQVLDIIRNSNTALSAKEISNHLPYHPALVRTTLTEMYRGGTVQRHAAAKLPGLNGKRPFKYFQAMPELVNAQPVREPTRHTIRVMVGDRSMTVTQARELYNQLHQLFG